MKIRLRAISFLTAMIFGITTLLVSAPSHGWSIFPEPPGYNILIVGVVKCMKNGVLTPEEGASVIITSIFNADDEYELPEPVSVTTNSNGLWIVSFTEPFSGPMPDSFIGEVTSKCGAAKEMTSGRFEVTYGYAAYFDFITNKAGNLYDVVKDAMLKYFKLSEISLAKNLPVILETEFMSWVSIVYTEVDCSDKPPVSTSTPKPVDVWRSPEEASMVPSELEPIPEPKTPDTPQPPSLSVPIDTTARPVENEYAACVKKCAPILDKLRPLERRLKALDDAKSDEMKKQERELKRLQDALRVNEDAGRQIKYIAPDGREHWGSPDFEQQYRDNGYQSVPGDKRISPKRQKYIDMLKRKIEETERDLNKAKGKDKQSKAKERSKIEAEMARMRKEYEDCINSCDKYKDDTAVITENAMIIKHSRPTITTSSGAGDLVRFESGSIGVSRSPSPGPARLPPSIPTPAPSGDNGGGMRIGEPVHLPINDTGDLDKAPPVSTDYYTTPVPGQKYEAPPTPGVSTNDSNVNPDTEEVQYKKVDGDRMTVDTAVSYKPTPTGMDVTTASVATGKGADFRKWNIDAVRMELDGEMINPLKEEDFYIEKDSYYRGAAAVTFAAIGSQYRRYSDKAQSGEVCPVTGQKKEAVDRKDTIHDGIDRAGMAAGMGLLASQARGSIAAKKATFKLNDAQAKKVLAGKGALRTMATNETAHERQAVETRLH